MTKIGLLRRQLASLRKTRQRIRWCTGYAGLILAVLWILAVLFVLDLVFHLSTLQRCVLITAAVGLVFWSYRRWTVPFLAVSEDDYDVALLVEQEHHIESDLIAAMQFERTEASAWGSTQLRTAVVEYVAELGGGLDIFQGLSREQLVLRGTLLAMTVALIAGVTTAFPGYVFTFVRRLFLAPNHYPTATRIQQVIINDHPVLIDVFDRTQPHTYKSAQGKQLRFEIHCSGTLPEQASIRIAAGSSQGRIIELHRRTLEQRLLRLRMADEMLVAALRDPGGLRQSDWKTEAVIALALDAPSIANSLRQSPGTPNSLEEIRERLAAQIEAWPGSAWQTAVYAGELPRVLDAMKYKVYAGDAWTDTAAIDVIALPLVEMRLKVHPPEYARPSESPRTSEPPRTSESSPLAVLEGSSIDFGLQVMNGKQLELAWLVATSSPEPRRLEFHQRQPGFWQLDELGSPFRAITDDVTFEVQVRDSDGISFERPLVGSVRVRADRPPTASQEIAHRVVLPTARPVLEYRVNDDFGVAQIQLNMQVEPASLAVTASNDDSGPSAANSIRTWDLLPSSSPLRGERLPFAGKWALDLAPLKLTKGDRVRVVLEVRDDRGERDGQSIQTDPLYLEISDENGVYAAILEADQKTEKQLTEIIQRELGIGETP